jgi:hypothetical protein
MSEHHWAPVALWRWAAGVSITVAMFTIGFMLGGYSVYARMDEHFESVGHPIAAERIKVLMEVNKEDTAAIFYKLERHAMILRDIEHQLATLANGEGK